MIYPDNFEERVGFDVIRRLLKEKCLGPAGKRRVDAIEFTSDYKTLETELTLAGEFREMLITIPGFPVSEYDDIEEEILRLKTAGTYLLPDTLMKLRHLLLVVNDILGFMRNIDSADFPSLTGIISDIYADDRIIVEISRILNEHGEIRDNASEKLHTIRKSISGLKSQIDKRIAQSLSQAKTQGWVSDESNITVRNGRLVIPVPAANKRRIKGFIYDQSATGQTVYIEPAEVFELNNDIRQLELSEQQEILKILLLMSDFIRPAIGDIMTGFSFLGLIDFLHAKAAFALEISGTKPLFSDIQQINWLEARHPLLYLSHKKLNKPVVPLDIRLSEAERILIISGPNSGGKSVCLKTVGLLQYMLQCGLLIPVRETSETGIFNNIFIDIGDQQSIDNDLSTYSSHLINIKNLIEFADSKTLFLIDEFGAGTEPQSGGAIAESALEILGIKKAYGVVTTHYANLKILASKGNGMINGAMLFDTKKMQPLFKLAIGKPGSSFAFEIASNIDFPAEVLNAAAEKAGTSKLDYDKLIQELDNERTELSLKEKQLQRADELLASMITKYETLKRDLDQKQKAILENARAEARKLIEDSNTLIEKTIREIKQSQADKAKTRQLRITMQQKAEELVKSLDMAEETPDKSGFGPKDEEVIIKEYPELGDPVRVDGQAETGEIEELSENDALVAFRTVKMRVPLHRLTVLKKSGETKKGNKTYDYRYHNIINDINARLANFKLSIDVRGYRGEEAVALVQRYIDEAVLLNVPEVSILHGKGNGILRRLIREYLQMVPEIRQVKDEILERGGHGITVVVFR